MPNRTIAFACVLLGIILLGIIIVASLEKSVVIGFEYLLKEWWGIATLVDLYAGFLLAGCWISWMEQKKAYAAIWILALFFFGNLIVMIYLAKLAWGGGQLSVLFTPKRDTSPV